MHLDLLLGSLDPDKQYLFSGSSDLKYLLETAYIEGVEILVKDGEIILLANPLVIGTLKDATGNRFRIQNIADQEALDTLYGGISELTVDSNATTLARKEALLNRGVVSVSSMPRILGKLRSVKTSREIDLIRESQAINLLAFKKLTAWIRIGMTEAEIAKRIKILHLECGAEGESFEPIVAFTENGANPHHINSPHRRLQDTDQILIDMGCVLRGYCSDMTRVVFMEGVPQPQRDLYELVRSVTLDCLAYGKVGMIYRNVYDRAKELLGEHSNLFTHTLSHNIGIDTHEHPMGLTGYDLPIEPGHVFSIEPGLYFPGAYGFRYEILAVATEDGLVELA